MSKKTKKTPKIKPAGGKSIRPEPGQTEYLPGVGWGWPDNKKPKGRPFHRPDTNADIYQG